jgi:hypothetical protein
MSRTASPGTRFLPVELLRATTIFALKSFIQTSVPGSCPRIRKAPASVLAF